MSRVFIWICVIAALVGRDARADRAEAERIFAVGAAAYAAGKYVEAAAAFEHAYEQHNAPEIAYSAAQAHRNAYTKDNDPAHVHRAIALYEAYLAGAPTGIRRADAEIHLKNQRAVAAKLPAVAKPAPSKPTIQVVVATEGATVSIDGQQVNRYAAVEVSPGEHTVAVMADRHVPVERKVTVTDRPLTIAIALKPRPGKIVVRSQRGARIALDGRPISAGSDVAAPAGKHVVTVFANGRRSVAHDIDLAPEQEIALDVALQPTGRRKAVPVVAITAGAFAGAAILTGAVALHASFSAAELRDRRTPLTNEDSARYRTLQDRRDAWRGAALGLGTAALTGGAVAAWLYYFDTPSATDLNRPVEQRPSGGGFAPMAWADRGGFGLGVGGVL